MLAEGPLFAELAEGAVETLVQALRIHEAQGGSEVTELRLRSCLMRCAYYYDTALADDALPVLEPGASPDPDSPEDSASEDERDARKPARMPVPSRLRRLRT